MTAKSLSSALVFHFLSVCIFAQTPSYSHYTTAEGLASSTVFSMIQDSKGLIWFATLNGVSKFDGSQFTTYRTVDGLNSNSIISIVEGEKGELYFGNFEKGVNVLKNGKIQNYFQEVQGEQFPINTLIFSPQSNNHHNIYAFIKQRSLNVIRENAASVVSSQKINMKVLDLIKLEKLSNGEIAVLTTEGLSTIQNDTVKKLDVTNLPDTEVFSLANIDDGSYFIGLKGKICQIKENRVIREINIGVTGENEVFSLLLDRNRNLWFTIMNKGIFFIPDGSDNIVDIGTRIGLQQTLVNYIIEDKEGNIWLSTYGKGAYCLKNLYLKNFSEADGMSSNIVNSIAKAKPEKILIGTVNGINILENGTVLRVPSKTGIGLIEYIHHIKKIDNELYICGVYGHFETNTMIFNGLKLQLSTRNAFNKTTNGLYLFGTPGNSVIVRQKFYPLPHDLYKFFVFGDNPSANRINEIIQDTDKNIWIGSSQGLCKALSPETIQDTIWKKTFFPENPVLNSRINAITEDQHKKVWFAGEKGVASYDLTNDSISTFTTIFGYDLSASTSTISDNQGRLWIGNMKGLYVFDSISVKHLSVHTGLPSNEVLSLYMDREENLLYIGTTNGLSVIDIQAFDKQRVSAPNVILTGIRAGDSVFSDYDNLVFKPQQHDVYVNFAGLNFSSPESVIYKYSINNEWMTTNQRSLSFINLRPGAYKLQIMAKAQNTDWGKPTLVTFRVLPGVTETIWFRLMIIGLIITFSMLYIRFRLNAQKKKTRNELELTIRINALKHQALSAMMNPHFISNSLNSVQYLVNSHRYEEANEYIAMMAKLMRKNLDSASSGFILLSEEIDRLKLYLDLEKMRFQDGFSYEIGVGTSISPSAVLIPNMIIQPFVENSLWHGILNSGQTGLLHVSFNFEDVEINGLVSKSLIIKVTDNGIGILEAGKHKKKDHISNGIHIIEERLKLLSTRMNLPKPIMFEDLSSRGSDSQGTEVIISLPRPLYKIIM
ncbi:MAG: two-component regulator propeller domain-containing protein [Bacteroidales bacterium]|nr:two-component regulator propeller domain-containing protein [Bacteroidales bacterium]